MLRGDDALASRGGELGVLKIDAEGAELDVLRGLAETIDRDRPLIICEVLPIGAPGSEAAELRRRRAHSVEMTLADAGYRDARNRWRRRPSGRGAPRCRTAGSARLRLRPGPGRPSISPPPWRG